MAVPDFAGKAGCGKAILPQQLAGFTLDCGFSAAWELKPRRFVFNIPNARSEEHGPCLRPPAPPHIPGVR